MSQTANPQSLIIMLVVIPLIVWRVYARVKRNVGRQKSVAWRHWTTTVVFPLLLILLGVGAFADASAAAGLVAGVVVGVGLATVGLRLTVFENTDDGLFYTPNAHIGIALSLLFTGRMLYRMSQLYLGGAVQSGGSDMSFARSPLTLAIFGMLAGYYVVYAVGILRWRRTQIQPTSVAPSLSGEQSR